MSDRIIRAATLGQVRAWVPKVIAASTASSAPVQGFSARREPDMPGVFTPSQEAQIRDALEQAHTQGEQHGYQSGYQSGFEQGLEKGLEEGQQLAALHAQQHDAATVAAEQADSLVVALQDALLNLDEQSQILQQQLPQWVTDIALAVARQVVGQAALVNVSDLADRIHAAVEHVADHLRAQMQLVMHPQTRQQLAVLKSSSMQALLAHVREDESLAPGGFMLRTAHGQQDHTIESRWRRAVETFSSDATHQRWV